MSNRWIRSERLIVIAHRGNSIAAPENTMPAYIMAQQLGADMIEADVNISRDGVLVMIHDWKLDRTTNLKGAIHETTTEDLLKADAGGWFSEEFRGVKIPTTEELLDFAKVKGISLCFEVKGGEPNRAKIIAEQITKLLIKYDAFEWVFLSSYFHDALAAAKKIAPHLMLAPERLPDDVEPDIREALRQVDRLRCDVLQIHHRYLYPEFMDAMHNANIAMWAWPTTTKEEILHAISRKADGVMGDDTEMAIDLVNKHCPLG
jgi:glycerophosphoryl diester phosphodiesterase